MSVNKEHTKRDSSEECEASDGGDLGTVDDQEVKK